MTTELLLEFVSNNLIFISLVLIAISLSIKSSLMFSNVVNKLLNMIYELQKDVNCLYRLFDYFRSQKTNSDRKRRRSRAKNKRYGRLL